MPRRIFCAGAFLWFSKEGKKKRPMNPVISGFKGCFNFYLEDLI